MLLAACLGDALSESRPALPDLLPASLLPSIASLPSSLFSLSCPPQLLSSPPLCFANAIRAENSDHQLLVDSVFLPAGHTSTGGDTVFFSFRRPGASRHIKTKPAFVHFCFFSFHTSLHYFPHTRLTLCGVAPALLSTPSLSRQLQRFVFRLSPHRVKSLSHIHNFYPDAFIKKKKTNATTMSFGGFGGFGQNNQQQSSGFGTGSGFGGTSSGGRSHFGLPHHFLFSFFCRLPISFTASPFSALVAPVFLASTCRQLDSESTKKKGGRKKRTSTSNRTPTGEGTPSELSCLTALYPINYRLWKHLIRLWYR